MKHTAWFSMEILIIGSEPEKEEIKDTNNYGYYWDKDEERMDIPEKKEENTIEIHLNYQILIEKIVRAIIHRIRKMKRKE